MSRKRRKAKQPRAKKHGTNAGNNRTVHRLVGAAGYIYNRQWLLIAAVVGIALLFRTIYLAGLVHNPTFLNPTLDAETHLSWARYYLSNGLNDPWEFFRAPGYPLFLSALLYISGKSLLFVRIIQVLLGSATTALVYLTGRNIFNRKTGLIASLFVATYWLFIYYDGELLITSLLVFLTTLLFYLLSRPQPFTWGNTAVIGLTAVVTLYTRPNIVLFIPFLIGWIFYHNRFLVKKRQGWLAESIKKGVLLTGIIGTAMLLFGLRQHTVSGNFSLLPVQGGINFYIGNSSIANGREAFALNDNSGSDDIFSERYRDYYWKQDNVWFTYTFEAYKQIGNGSVPSQAETSSYWLGRSFEYIRENKGKWIGLMLRKTYYLLNSHEISSNQDISANWKKNAGILAWARPHLFGILLVLIALFMLIERKQLEKHLPWLLFLLVSGAGIVLFFVNTRFRMPLLPLLGIYASAGIFAVHEKRSSFNGRTVLAAGLIIAVITTLTYSRMFDVTKSESYHFHYNLGKSLLEEKRYAEARVEFEEAVQQYPANTTYLNNLAFANIQLKNYNEAARHLQLSSRIDPEKTETLYYLGLNLYYQRKYQDAAMLFSRVIQLDPDFPEANFWVRYAGLSESGGDRDSADRFYRKAITILEAQQQKGDQNADNTFLLGILYSLFDRNNEAARFMKIGIDLDPDDPEKHANLADLLNRMGDTNQAQYHYNQAEKLGRRQ
jgi:tetratricopeptide (TPR) repeat protein